MFNLTPHSLFARLFFAAALSCTLAGVSAQAGDAQLAMLDPIRTMFPQRYERFAPGGPATEETAPKTNAVVFYKNAKRVSAAYEGFAIELALADRPLLHDNQIFRKFGNVRYDRTPEGRYSYFILIPFTSKKAVETFLEVVVKPKNPEAKMLEYGTGGRKELGEVPPPKSE